MRKNSRREAAAFSHARFPKKLLRLLFLESFPLQNGKKKAPLNESRFKIAFYPSKYVIWNLSTNKLHLEKVGTNHLVPESLFSFLSWVFNPFYALHIVNNSFFFIFKRTTQ